MGLSAGSTNDLYVVKYLSSGRGMMARYFEVHATDPRDAVTKFGRLVPRGVAVDVFPPPVPPEAWR